MMNKIRHYLIPHHSNNYQPLALRPHRILAYGLVSIAVKVIMLGLAFFVPIDALVAPDFLLEQRSKIIAFTNDLRHDHGLPALKENIALDNAALKKAQDMLIKQYFAHIGPDGKDVSAWLKAANYSYDVAGENLALGFLKAEDAMAAWENSPTHYQNLVDQDFEEIGVGLVSGNYDKEDTVFISQVFAVPRIEAVQKIDMSKAKKAINPKKAVPVKVSAKPAEGKVLGMKEDNPSSSRSLSWAERYILMKAYQPDYARNVLIFSSVYYRLALSLLLVLFLTNIFVEIRKQHLHLIFPSACLIFLLSVFLII